MIFREDVVCTSLNPTADYKASVLSGLAPSVIIEIANHALGFWTYQQSMEANYQALLLKEAQEKTELAVQDKHRLESQAKKEIKSLVQRLERTESALSLEKRRAVGASTSHRNHRAELEKFRLNPGRPGNTSHSQKNHIVDAHLDVMTPITSSRGLSRTFPRDKFILGGPPPRQETYNMPQRLPVGPKTANLHSSREMLNAEEFPKLRDLGTTYQSHPKPRYRHDHKKSRRQFSDTSLGTSQGEEQINRLDSPRQTRKDRHSWGKHFMPSRP